MRHVAIGIGCLLGIVFLVSSSTKLGRAFDAFAASVRDLGLVPVPMVRPVAGAVVTAEFAVWMLLAIPLVQTQLLGFAIGLVLLLIFCVGITLSIRTGAEANCQCFGASTVRLGIRHVVRNALLAVAAIAGAAGVLAGGPVSATGVLVAVFVGLLAGGVTVLLDGLVHIVDLFRPLTSWEKS